MASGQAPMYRRDLKGVTFGRLRVMYYLGRAPDKWGGAIWRCQCECGAYLKVRRNSLISGTTKSCGCLLREFRKWNGAEGVVTVVQERTEVGSDDDETDAVYDKKDEYAIAVRRTRALIQRFGVQLVRKAIREINKEV